jgi:prophage antirepressor-like protein
MNNELMLFKNEKFGNVRMIKVDGKPYAIANDVAVALGYKRPADAITSHCKGSVKHRVLTKGGEQKVKVIPQGDIIRLAVKCPLDGADEFESWIFDTVIPSVLNYGAYIPNATPEETKKIAQTFKASKYLNENVHDKKSLRTYIRNYEKLQLEDCIVELANIFIPMKGSIKHDLLNVAIKELKALNDSLIYDTSKNTFIKNVCSDGIILMQDIKIGKQKKLIRRLERAV